MNTQIKPMTRPQHRMNQFGARVASQLDDALQGIPRDVGERLRAARVQALANRRVPEPVRAPALVAQGSAAVLGGGFGFWGRAAFVLPLLALTLGLLGIGSFQEQWRASEIAEVDAELLTGDLPPSAYTDPGFAQYLKLDVKD